MVGLNLIYPFLLLTDLVRGVPNSAHLAIVPVSENSSSPLDDFRKASLLCSAIKELGRKVKQRDLSVRWS